ncbi:MAG: transglycosylase SLT domain-containing protein [Nitrospirota bacterium]
MSSVATLSLLLAPSTMPAADYLHTIQKKESIRGYYDRTIEFFTKKVPEAFDKKLTLAYKYIDLITPILDEKGIPADIAYLPLIESGFSPFAVGAGDAVGLWQFVRGTAQKYGLKIDTYVDERKDPVKSTRAAAHYLKDLYRLFGKWDLALAAYNAGEGKVRNYQKSNAQYLPDFLNRYIGTFVAVAAIARDPERYGFQPNDDMHDEDYVEITTDQSISLKTLAAKYDTTVKTIREMNPALLTDYTPPYAYRLRLPTY